MKKSNEQRHEKRFFHMAVCPVIEDVPNPYFFRRPLHVAAIHVG